MHCEWIQTGMREGRIRLEVGRQGEMRVRWSACRQRKQEADRHAEREREGGR